MLKLMTYALFPVIAVQGYFMKKNTPRLSEPQGDRAGCIGQGRPLSILILGDSAAAGVGVDEQQQALLGNLLSELQDYYTVHYQLHAKTGRTSSQLLKVIQQFEAQHFDVVISSIGVNDVTRMTSPQDWMVLQQDIYAEIEQRFSPLLVLCTEVPPLNDFPALKAPLSWLCGQYVKQMNHALAYYVDQKPNYQLIRYELEKFQALKLEMAADGFHPSQSMYQLWAEQLADHILNTFSYSGDNNKQVNHDTGKASP
ncbi:SGNH/GDSL hydrolase family protein [Acinetobacter larvae]|uniref:Lipase n=1 Tax=Acinetobacter larvae TaxID=1789224 RepID=A0A1B2LZN7_9GAMM|nr:SGNH/GDSL hydrolase family protein [Acinetobacter larvae]AOA58418.1 lipase [Acinetobacter larvae]